MNIPIEQIFLAVGTLCGTIGYLFRLYLKTLQEQKELEKERLQKCEEDRQEMRTEVKNLYGEVHEMKGKMEGIENLSLSVLEKLEDLNDNTKNSRAD